MFVGHTGITRDICWANDINNRFLSCSNDGTIKLWNINYKQYVKSLSEDAWIITFSPSDSDQFLSCDNNGTIKLWGINIGVCIRKFSNPGQTNLMGTVKRINWVKNSNEQFLSCSNDGTIILWNINSKSHVRMFVGHSMTARAIIWVKNNNDRFLSCSADGTIKLWDMNSDKCIVTFVGDIPFTLWNIISGNYFRGSCGIMYMIWIPNNENKFLSCGDNGSINLWRHTIGNSLLTYVKDWDDINTN